MGNPYKNAPFTLRAILLLILVSALPAIELYKTSAKLKAEVRSKLAEQSASQMKLVETKANFEQIQRLNREIEEMQQRFSVMATGQNEDFRLSELIRTAADISTRQGVVVDYLQAKDPFSPALTDHQDIDIGLIGQFTPVLQFMQQLLKSQRRVTIVDVDILGNDPLKQYFELTHSNELPSPQELQQISSVRVKATLRVVHKL